MSTDRFVVPAERDGHKLDRLVAAAAGVSRRIARLWIAAGRVQVGGRTVRILTRPVAAGARIDVLREAPPALSASPAPVPILHLDRQVVAVDKPAGLLSETDRFGSPSLQTVLPGLLQARGEHPRLWLVHRLDAGTSGVMILARSASAAAALSDSFRHGVARKTYLALCAGVLRAGRGIDAPIGRLAGTRHGVTRAGKPAQTAVQPLAVGSAATLVRARPRTGRTHQIRVHLAHLGHPIVGDRLYGGPGFTGEAPPRAIGRPMLHARRLVVPHPGADTPLDLSAALPADFLAVARAFAIEPDALPV